MNNNIFTTAIIQSEKCNAGEILISKKIAKAITSNQMTVTLIRYPISSVIKHIPWYKKVWYFVTRKKNIDFHDPSIKLKIIGESDKDDCCYMNSSDLIRIGADFDMDVVTLSI